MEWILAHLSEIALGILVADKIVAKTPCKWDDLIVTSIKEVLGVVTGGKKKKIDAGV